VIREELVAIRDAHKVARRTQIVADDTGEISTVALVEDEPLFVTVTARGYVVTRPGRGRGAKVAEPGERDAVAQLIETSTLSGVLFFSDRGRAYRMAGHDLPKNRLTAAPNLFQLGDGEQIVAVIDANVAEEHEHVVFVTASGAVKRTELAEFVDAGARRDGILAMKLADGDRVVSVFPGWDEFEIFVATRSGQGIRFAEDEVRTVGRSAGGIRAMRLKGDDAVVGACAVAHEEQVVLATDAGYAKRLRVDELPVQARGGAGVRVMRLDRKRGSVAAVAPVADRTVFVLDESAVTVPTTEIKLVARDAVGAAVPGVRTGAAVARVVPSSAVAEAD
jgi:DNA gyrase subunit A